MKSITITGNKKGSLDILITLAKKSGLTVNPEETAKAKKPNSTTLKAMEEAKKGGLPKFKNVASLFKTLTK